MNPSDLPQTLDDALAVIAAAGGSVSVKDGALRLDGAPMDDALAYALGVVSRHADELEKRQAAGEPVPDAAEQLAALAERYGLSAEALAAELAAQRPAERSALEAMSRRWPTVSSALAVDTRGAELVRAATGVDRLAEESRRRMYAQQRRTR